MPVLFVGVRWPVEVIMERRHGTKWNAAEAPDAPVPPPVLLWRRVVHVPGLYDLKVDTSASSPAECAAVIRRRLGTGPAATAFRQIAAMAVVAV